MNMLLLNAEYADFYDAHETRYFIFQRKIKSKCSGHHKNQRIQRSKMNLKFRRNFS